jgi:hypothetical protein
MECHRSPDADILSTYLSAAAGGIGETSMIKRKEDDSGDALHHMRAFAARRSPSPLLCKFAALGALSLRDVARKRHHVAGSLD